MITEMILPVVTLKTYKLWEKQFIETALDRKVAIVLKYPQKPDLRISNFRESEYAKLLIGIFWSFQVASQCDAAQGMIYATGLEFACRINDLGNNLGIRVEDRLLRIMICDALTPKNKLDWNINPPTD